MAAPSRSFVVIVAAAAGALGIGKNGTLPWRLAGDMTYFKNITSTAAPGKINAVIMGRKTWQSIPERFRPLSGRRNVVLSRNPAAREELLLPDDVMLASSLTEALSLLARAPNTTDIDKVFVIGGGTVYREAIGSSSAVLEGAAATDKSCERVLMTSIRAGDGRFDDCDVHFPALAPDKFRLASRGPIKEENGIEYSFDEYENIVHTKANTKSVAAGEKGVGDNTGRGDDAAEEVQAQDGSEHKELRSRKDMFKHDGDGDPVGGAAGSLKEKGADAAEPSSCTGPAVPPASAPVATLAPAADGGHQEEEGNEEEMQYLRLVEDILQNGVRREDRTGTGTLSKFGVQMRFSLRQNRFPLLTTKRVFWRGVAEELFWFISGCTNANVLKDKRIHIWDANGSREFLNGLGLTQREEGDLGPVYGFQWRHFGAEYTDMHADYTGKGVDQLAECIKKIRTNPEDRRIVLTAWNPADLGKMALPPCHMFCQFYVANGELSCQMYQRSADMGLGVPFNIASYALLTRLVAQACGLKAGEFVHTIGDAHVYLNHVDALREQLRRKPRPFPTLSIEQSKTNIDSFQFSDLQVKGYVPHKTIPMKMAV